MKPKSYSYFGKTASAALALALPIAASAVTACYSIDEVKECPHTTPGPNECVPVPGSGWTREGPFYPDYVSQKTLLTTLHQSGTTILTLKCSRRYTFSMPGHDNTACDPVYYGTQTYSFPHDPCVVGGSGS